MAVRFIEGFDHYTTTGDLTKKWSTRIGGQGIAVGSGRISGNCARREELGKTFDNQATWIVGVGIWLDAHPTTAAAVLQFFDSTTVQACLRINPEGTLSVVRGASTAVTDGTSVATLLTNAWYYIEMQITIADSIGAGTCKVFLNGDLVTPIITVATGQDLKAGTNAYANVVKVGSSNVTMALKIDDIYILDGTGSANNAPLGDCVVDTSFVDSDGTYSDFTPSTGSTHYALVDESTPNTTDYVDGGTVGHRDSYGIASIRPLADDTIYAVQVCAALNKDDAGTRSAALFVRSSTTNDDGVGVALPTSQVIQTEVFEQDPAAAVAWTQSGVNAMQVGVVVTA